MEEPKRIVLLRMEEVAKILQKTLAQRLSPSGHPIPLIAETGGQNAMIVDSSALTEQVILDVVSSAYDSAGQRCSAIASRSAVIPSRVTFPAIQCHHTCGFADAGGLANPFARSSFVTLLSANNF